MKYIIPIAIFILININLTFGQNIDSKDFNNKWKLVWEDNFDSINNNIWTLKNYFDHYGETQVFTTNNVYSKNGKLVLELKKENYSCPANAIDSNWNCVTEAKTKQPYLYTSGWIETKAKYNIQFGYIEARIKFPYNKNLWPAFWTFIGDSIMGFSNYSEIDIAEMLGETGKKTIQTNIHRFYPDTEFTQLSKPKGYKWTRWHTYAIEWSPTKITWLLDGNVFRTIKNHGIIDPVKLILEVALRPNKNYEKMKFPYKMLTDYVRVYKLNEDL